MKKKILIYERWSMHILNLYGMDRCQGYKFTYFHSSLAFLDVKKYIIWIIFFNRKYNIKTIKINKDFRHEAPLQWNVLFNMSILKMISFSMDYHWSVTG